MVDQAGHRDKAFKIGIDGKPIKLGLIFQLFNVINVYCKNASLTAIISTLFKNKTMIVF